MMDISPGTRLHIQPIVAFVYFYFYFLNLETFLASTSYVTKPIVSVIQFELTIALKQLFLLNINSSCCSTQP